MEKRENQRKNPVQKNQRKTKTQVLKKGQNKVLKKVQSRVLQKIKTRVQGKKKKKVKKEKMIRRPREHHHPSLQKRAKAPLRQK